MQSPEITPPSFADSSTDIQEPIFQHPFTNSISLRCPSHTKLTLFGMTALFGVSIFFVVWYYIEDLALMVSLGNCKNTTMFSNLIDLANECTLRRKLSCYSDACPFDQYQPYSGEKLNSLKCNKSKKTAKNSDKHSQNLNFWEQRYYSNYTILHPVKLCQKGISSLFKFCSFKHG